MRTDSLIRSMITLAGLWLVCWCSSAGAAEATTVSLDQAYREVANMTGIERDRIQRNFEGFEKLPAERQQHLRNLHAELEADAKTGGDLHAVMQTYSMWLKTLTPGQRDDLRRETDALKRMQLVKKFKEEQDARNEAQAMYVGSWNERRNRMGRGPALGVADVQTILEMTFKDLPADLQREAQALSGLSRSRKILESSFRQAGGRPRWPLDPQLDRFTAAIGDPDLRKQLESKKGVDQRLAFLGMFFRGLGGVLGAEIERKLPSEADLQGYFGQLDSTRRDELMQLPPDDARKRLTFMFVQEKSPELKALFEMRRDLGPTFGNMGPGGMGGPGMGPGGGSGERGPGGGPGDRPPGDRGNGERGPRGDGPRGNGQPR